MARVLRRHWIGRLLAATLSLGLALASTFGAAARARDHVHHHDGAAPQAVHQHFHYGDLGAHQPDEEAATTVEEGGRTFAASAAGAGVPKPDPLHHTCMDFVCHGGIAILASVGSWQAPWWPQGRLVAWQSDHVVCVSPARLDRPPKAFAPA
ncbi:MAG: hypothetical protein AB7O44_27330 [Hyphomicrobiaceae bacterium]